MGNSIFFYDAGYREDCFYAYAAASGRYLSDYPVEEQGLTNDIETFEINNNLLYAVQATEPCVSEGLGFYLWERVYIRAENAPDTFVYPKEPYAVVLGSLLENETTYTKGDVEYPVVLRLGLAKNDPIQSKIRDMGFKSYGLVACIDPTMSMEHFEYANNVVRTSKSPGGTFISGKEFNDQIRAGRTAIPSGIYFAMLVPALIEVFALFAFVSVLQRKTREEIFALRLVGASKAQCRRLLWGKSFLQSSIGFVLSFLLFLPWTIPLTASTPVLLPLGEGICFAFILLLMTIFSGRELKKAFYQRPNREE
ncbi:MAG: ABC transporter permease [Candidatus Enteromonas sp.]